MIGRDILIAMLPEHLLLAGIVTLLVLEITLPRPRGALAISLVVVIAASVVSLSLAIGGYASAPFPGQYSVGPADLLAKAIVLGLAVPVLLLSRDEFTESRFHLLFLSSLYGVCLLLSADSFLTLFLGLELMSLPVYALVLLAFRRPQSAEAALKYLVLGGTASATLLMGASLLYGGSGSLALSTFAGALASHDAMATSAVVSRCRRLFPEGCHRSLPYVGPRRVRRCERPGYRLHGDDHQGRHPARRRSPIRRFARRATSGRSPRNPAADLDRVGQSGGNAAGKLSPHDRVFVDCSCGLPVLRFARRGGRAVPGGRVLRPRLWAHERARFCVASAPRGRCGGGSSRQPARAFRQGAVRRRDGRHRHAVAGRHPALPGFVAKFLIFKNVIAAGYTTYAVLGLIGSYLGIYFYLRVIQFMFMSAEVPAADHGRSRKLALGAALLCLLPSIVISIFPGWVIGQL
jgi:NADH-quinone oxidoreductase subunit N